MILYKYINVLKFRSTGAAGPWHRALLRPSLLTALWLAAAAGSVAAQTPQPETFGSAPPLLREDAPEATPPGEVPPETEDDDASGKGCPYLGNTLELIV